MARRARQPNAPLSAIPNSLASLRLAMNLKQVDVAEELGTARGTYSIIEAGYSIPSKDMADRLCRFFDRELIDLFPDDVIRRIT